MTMSFLTDLLPDPPVKAPGQMVLYTDPSKFPVSCQRCIHFQQEGNGNTCRVVNVRPTPTAHCVLFAPSIDAQGLQMPFLDLGAVSKLNTSTRVFGTNNPEPSMLALSQESKKSLVATPIKTVGSTSKKKNFAKFG